MGFVCYFGAAAYLADRNLSWDWDYSVSSCCFSALNVVPRNCAIMVLKIAFLVK